MSQCQTLPTQLYQLSSVCKQPDKPHGLAARQAAVWARMPRNVAGYEALANVLIDNQYISFALDDSWGSGRFKSDSRCVAHTYDPSLGYMYDYWIPTGAAPVNQNENVQDSKMAIYDQVDPAPRRLATATSWARGHRYSWQR